MVKDKECKAYIHTYKCSETSCDDCEYRYPSCVQTPNNTDDATHKEINEVPHE